MAVILELCDIAKSYTRGDETVLALPPTSLTITTGELLAVTGPSGSGKSTLLAIAGLLLSPDHGEVRVRGEVVGPSADERAARRAQTFGYVFQGFNLFEHLTAAENVLDGLRGASMSRVDRSHAVRDALERVGIGARADHLPNELSGGEQQRVAIARALVKRPSILLADEPTGNLDAENTALICDLLVEAANDTTVILVTHDAAVANRFPRVFTPSGAEVGAE